jgi:hypothetical protein
MRQAHILTYHSGNIDGNDYGSNDLVALAADLEMLRRLGISVVPLRDLADAVIRRSFSALPERAVAISLDDGLDFDFLPLVHPLHGPQLPVHQILRNFSTRHHAPVHATSFVIAGPVARTQIAHGEMEGLQWINDSWWPAAVASGLFHIGNHSWDHVSPSAAHGPGESARRASSRYIDNLEAAHQQVRAARDYIEQIVPNPGSALLAFPYGDYSTYLIEDYLPDDRNRHGTVAAFTAEPGPVTEDSNRWVLPRYLCRNHWNSPEALAALLADR